MLFVPFETSVIIMGLGRGSTPIKPTIGFIDRYLYDNTVLPQSYSLDGPVGLDQNITIQGLSPGTSYDFSLRGFVDACSVNGSAGVLDDVCTREYSYRKTVSPSILCSLCEMHLALAKHLLSDKKRLFFGAFQVMLRSLFRFCLSENDFSSNLIDLL